jgi:ribonuclease BN (tRNA processing enzyme)
MTREEIEKVDELARHVWLGPGTAMADSAENFRVRFWGVRGSYPVSNPKKLEFGGHTSCVEIEAGGNRFVFDAGTGIIPLGKRLLENHKSPLHLCIFLSHTHHDHLIGLYFFEPLLKETTTLAIFGPNSARKSLRATLRAAMDSEFFPVGLEDLKAQKKIYSLHGGERIRVKAGDWKPRVEHKKSSDPGAFDGVTIDTFKSSSHPRTGVLLYRLSYQNKSVVYATDIEQEDGGYPDVIDFVRGTDVLIHDAQYVGSEYFSQRNPRRGWGHSTFKMAVEVARKAKVKQLILFHHEPAREDKDIREIERKTQKLFPASLAAYEGMQIKL